MCLSVESPDVMGLSSKIFKMKSLENIVHLEVIKMLTL